MINVGNFIKSKFAYASNEHGRSLVSFLLGGFLGGYFLSLLDVINIFAVKHVEVYMGSWYVDESWTQSRGWVLLSDIKHYLTNIDICIVFSMEFTKTIL